MSVLQSRNPAMGVLQSWDKTFLNDQARPKAMTIGGTLSATAVLLGIVAAVGVVVWQQLTSAARAAVATGGTITLPAWAFPALIGTLIAGVGVSLLIAFKPRTAPFAAPIHAGVEGVFVGLASFIIPLRFLGPEALSGAGAALVMQAMLATFAICAAMLLGYASGILRLSGFARKMIITMGVGLGLYVGLLYLLRIFGIDIWNGYATTGAVGIGFTAFCLVLASLYLLLDFEFIEQGVQSGAPKYMEWVGAWGLMVTLVWVYVEALRLLSKLRSRN